MKKIFILLKIIAMICCLTVTANAQLVDNGDGTITDTDRGLMYYDYSYYTNDWNVATNWIDTLNSSNNLGYNDWKLPSALNSDGSDPCLGLECSDSDLGHLYYIEGVTPTSTGPFKNFPLYEKDFNRYSWYWTETVSDVDSSAHWIFAFQSGDQHTHYDVYDPKGYAVAVRVVPEPISSTLFIIGSATLGVRRFCKRNNG